MSAEKYPLTKALGLRVYNGEFRAPEGWQADDVVRAADVERLLEQARIVHMHLKPGLVARLSSESAEDDTHTARLLCIEPIVKKTFELKIDEAMPPNEFHILTGNGKRHVFKLTLNFPERARRLLEKGE